MSITACIECPLRFKCYTSKEKVEERQFFVIRYSRYKNVEPVVCAGGFNNEYTDDLSARLVADNLNSLYKQYLYVVEKNICADMFGYAISYSTGYYRRPFTEDIYEEEED